LAVLREEPAPDVLADGLAVAEEDAAVFALDIAEQHLDLIADAGRPHVAVLVAPFVERDEALALVADIDENAVSYDVDHAASDDLAGLELLFFCLVPVIDGPGLGTIKHLAQFVTQFPFFQIVPS